MITFFMCVIDTNHIVLVNCNCNQTLNHLQSWEYHSDIIGLIFIIIISAAQFCRETGVKGKYFKWFSVHK